MVETSVMDATSKVEEGRKLVSFCGRYYIANCLISMNFFHLDY